MLAVTTFTRLIRELQNQPAGSQSKLRTGCDFEAISNQPTNKRTRPVTALEGSGCKHVFDLIYGGGFIYLQQAQTKELIGSHP